MFGTVVNSEASILRILSKSFAKVLLTDSSRLADFNANAAVFRSLGPTIPLPNTLAPTVTTYGMFSLSAIALARSAPHIVHLA